MQSDSLLGHELGRVRLDSIIGEGAVGKVYRGYHSGLGIPVAVKVIKSDPQSAGHNFLARFQQEAQIAARLDHPGIVRVLDFGREDDVTFLVMEFIDGFSLKEYLKRCVTMSERNAIRLMIAVAKALDAAHESGIVHRDLKPANLLLTRKGAL